jgi:hypothetical protein
MKPITDKAEISVDFPGKVYMGGFGPHSEFAARADGEEMTIQLYRPGEDRRRVDIALHHYLFAGILEELASSVAENPPIDEPHRAALHDAALALAGALGPSPRKKAAKR